MFKLSLLIIMTSLMCFSAYSKSYIQSHDDFLNMSNDEKDQLIIKTMELVVELETKYDYEVKKFGFNQKRFDEFQQAIVKLQSFFIPSAYAQDTSNWNRFATNFTRLFSSSKKAGANCIFAGWPSTMHKGADGKTYCAHPGGKAASLEVKSSYPTPLAGSGCSKLDTSKIQCNPTLFGFKKASQGSLFCVEATNGAKNSAYHCMLEALKDSNASDKSRDTKEDRLAIIRQGLSKNPQAFKSLQEYVYQICVCPTVPKKFDKSYHSRILPHRTCYGMMDMMGEVTMCNDPNLVMDTSIFKALRDFAKNTIYQTQNEEEIDDHYRKFIKEEVIKAAPAEYQRLCGATASSDDGVSVTDTDSPTAISSNPSGVNPPGTTTTPGTPSSTDIGDGTDTANDYVCSKAKCSWPENKNEEAKCEFTIMDKAGAEIELKETPKYTAPKAEDKDVAITAIISEKEVALSCSLEDPSQEEPNPNTDDNKPSLTITITKKEESFYSLKAETKNDEGWSFSWSIVDFGTLKVDKGWTKAPKKKVTKKSNDGLAPDSEEDVSTKDETTTSDKKTGEGDKTTTEKETGKEEEKKSSDKANDVASDSKEIPAQKRYTTSYKVCGQLSKGKEKIPKDPSCVTIDKLKTAGPPVNRGQNPMQIRGSSDTSAIGIK